ncbi:MAG TPA: response regulator transcription factor [Thermomicrobiaceae bacterium]|nr:response regulator transcription factor [Thermomicrobiaceae bacterium]
MTFHEATRRILVVEDDPSISELIAWALDDAGFDVRTAPTLAEALAIVQQDEPDLVVADFLLPDGLGSELVRRIRQHDGVATLVMSSHPSAREHGASVGADACLPKPFDLDEFFETVETLLQHGPGDHSWSVND